MNKTIKTLLVASTANIFLWITIIPIWQYPDEQAHFAQVQDIAEIGDAPINSFDTSNEISLSEKYLDTERNSYGNNKFTYHPEYKINYSNNNEGPFEKIINNLDITQRTNLVKNEATHNPPLYHHFGVLAYKSVYQSNLFARVMAVRIMSGLLFIITVYLSFRFSKLLFSNDIKTLILPTIVAFKPMLVFSSTGVLPDPLTNLLFTAILLSSILILKHGLKKNLLIASGAIIILGLFTRQQFLLSVPILGLPIFFHLRKHLFLLIRFLIILTPVAIFLILINFYPLNSPITSFFMIPELSSIPVEKINLDSFLIHTKWTLENSIYRIWPWYWGVYKWLSLTLPPIYYQIINRIILIAVLGIIVKIISYYNKKELFSKGIKLLFLIYSSLIYFLIFLIWDYIQVIKSGYSFGIQGRYFFPLVVAHLSILLIGINHIFSIFFSKRKNYLLVIVAGLMVLFNDLSLYHISSSYYDISSLNNFIIQASQYKPILFKGYWFIAIIILTISTQLYLMSNLILYASKAQKKSK